MDHEQWKAALSLAEPKEKRAVLRASILEQHIVEKYSAYEGVTLEQAEFYLRDERRIFRRAYVDSHDKFLGILGGAQGLKLLDELTTEAITVGVAEGAFRVMLPNLTGVNDLVWATWKNSPSYLPAIQEKFAAEHENFILEKMTYREDPFKRLTIHFSYKTPRDKHVQEKVRYFQPGSDTGRIRRQ
jgi:hypothetical protein